MVDPVSIAIICCLGVSVVVGVTGIGMQARDRDEHPVRYDHTPSAYGETRAYFLNEMMLARFVHDRCRILEGRLLRQVQLEDGGHFFMPEYGSSAKVKDMHTDTDFYVNMTVPGDRHFIYTRRFWWEKCKARAVHDRIVNHYDATAPAAANQM